MPNLWKVCFSFVKSNHKLCDRPAFDRLDVPLYESNTKNVPWLKKVEKDGFNGVCKMI